MIKQHTAQSLGKYLDKRVYVKKHLPIVKELLSKYDEIVPDGEYRICGLSVQSPDISVYLINDRDDFYSDKAEYVYPILKPASAMTDEDLMYCLNKHGGDSENPSEIVDGGIGHKWPFRPGYEENGKTWEWAISVKKDFTNDSTYDGIRLHQVEKLFEKGYGAIPNPESPTGYIDFWGYPCVVLEGGK